MLPDFPQLEINKVCLILLCKDCHELYQTFNVPPTMNCNNQ